MMDPVPYLLNPYSRLCVLFLLLLTFTLMLRILIRDLFPVRRSMEARLWDSWIILEHLRLRMALFECILIVEFILISLLKKHKQFKLLTTRSLLQPCLVKTLNRP